LVARADVTLAPAKEETYPFAPCASGGNARVHRQSSRPPARDSARFRAHKIQPPHSRRHRARDLIASRARAPVPRARLSIHRSHRSSIRAREPRRRIERIRASRRVPWRKRASVRVTYVYLSRQSRPRPGLTSRRVSVDTSLRSQRARAPTPSRSIARAIGAPSRPSIARPRPRRIHGTTHTRARDTQKTTTTTRARDRSRDARTVKAIGTTGCDAIDARARATVGATRVVDGTTDRTTSSTLCHRFPYRVSTRTHDDAVCMCHPKATGRG